MIKVLFIVYITYLYMPIAKELADSFAQGAGLEAGKKFDTFMREQTDKQMNKVAHHAGSNLAEGTKNVANFTGRKVSSLGRRAKIATINRMGTSITPTHPGALSSVKSKMGTVHHTASGTVLQRTKKLANGRRKEIFSDDYSTTTIVYDRSGNEISKEVKFKHSFLKEHLIDARGNMNMDAFNTLMNSPAAKLNPELREAMLAQIAINRLETKGKNVGRYYKSRNIVVDSHNPNKIELIQEDFDGKKTKVALDISSSGQVAVGYSTRYTKPHPFNPSNVSGNGEFFFDNGDIQISTDVKYNKDGSIADEITRFKYGAHIQKGHDSILSNDESNQIINSSGTIASDVDATRLFHGIDDMLSKNTLNPSSTTDVKDSILNMFVDGRKNRTNKFRTTGLSEKLVVS